MEQAERDRYLNIVRTTPTGLTAALRGVPRKLLTWRPAPGKWSIHEIVCHLRDVERFFVERYGKVANHDRPALRVFNQDELASAPNYNEDELRATLREFQDLRQETLTILSALAHQSWQRIGLHPKRGEFSIAAAAAHHVEHDTTHLNQLRALRERFA